ncbi:flavin-dependent oxidoreductase [Beijerinckia sp. L45]|uniref:flavin-dependent oxidoreductase n=1 Tax=Beijerinckia sp. L45 TaxID=1641855 RepID=UPI00131BA478|nr:flavin-dependent oxidoreductase [Beijerinckia sp. L45]
MKVLIAGAGIGGLTTALFLQRQGMRCEIFEQAKEIRALGVGIVLMPHAVAQLAALDLLPELDAIATRSAHMYYETRRGQGVWDEPRGMLAGHAVPQFFVHRGLLQTMLFEAACRTLPEGSIHLGQRFEAFRQTADGVTVDVVAADGTITAAHGDVLVGADGIHSVVRQRLVPQEGPPLWSGLMMWRGAADWATFKGGASMLIAGGVDAKVVCYPIGPGTTPETRLTNWVVCARTAPFGATPPRREDWARPGQMADLAPLLKQFTIDTVNVDALVAATGTFWEYPMCDRDPIAHWSQGRVTLLGDAAHPMYPMGGNGASQAILDARCLSDALATHDEPVAALKTYEQDRLPGTSEIVRLNRGGGPEAVIDAIEVRAPDGFADIDAVLSRGEREQIVRGYASKSSVMSARAVAQSVATGGR